MTRQGRRRYQLLIERTTLYDVRLTAPAGLLEGALLELAAAQIDQRDAGLPSLSRDAVTIEDRQDKLVSRTYLIETVRAAGELL